MASAALVALCLGPALAHLFELPNKMGLARDAYFTVQQIYAGWALFAIPIIAALISLLALAWLTRRRRAALAAVLAALACMVAAQALFWLFTYPANQATANWTTIPAHWEALRAQWEYSHAGGALFTYAALLALVAAALLRQRRPA